MRPGAVPGAIAGPQIRPSIGRNPPRFSKTPSADPLVVAREEDVWHWASVPIGRTREMGVFQQAFFEAFLIEGRF
jgi:hypothetical protein